MDGTNTLPRQAKPSALCGALIVLLTSAVLLGLGIGALSYIRNGWSDAMRKWEIMERGAKIDAERERQYYEQLEKSNGVHAR